MVLPADFTKLVFAGVAGWLFFSELPEIWIWIGGTIVFTGVFLNTWFEKRARDAVGLAPVPEVSQTPSNNSERPP